MLIPIIFTGVTGYFIYDKIISSKLDTPQNNPSVKGLEKAEIREAIKENETKVKQLKEEIKKIEKERKDILEGSDDDKADQAKAKLEEKTDRIKELEQTEQDLSDLKTVENGE
jgi:septin family protein